MSKRLVIEAELGITGLGWAARGERRVELALVNWVAAGGEAGVAPDGSWRWRIDDAALAPPSLEPVPKTLEALAAEWERDAVEIAAQANEVNRDDNPRLWVSLQASAASRAQHAAELRAFIPAAPAPSDLALVLDALEPFAHFARIWRTSGRAVPPGPPLSDVIYVLNCGANDGLLAVRKETTDPKVRKVSQEKG